MRALITACLACVVMALVTVGAQERIEADVYWKIRREGTDHSRLLDTLQVLTDVHGPRLTGSPSLKAAGEWALEQMQAWGLTGRLEPWDFDRPGWANHRLTAHLVSPVRDALVVEALAWTPGTDGPVRGGAVSMTLPEWPTRDSLDAYLEPLAHAVRGSVVFVGEPRQVLVTFNPPALRREDSAVIAQMGSPPAGPPPQAQNPPSTPAPAAAAPAAPSTPAPAQAAQAAAQAASTAPEEIVPDPPAPPEPRRDLPLTPNLLEELVNQFLVDHGALARVNDAGRDHGQIRAFNNRSYDPDKSPPTLVMRNEDYGRIWRLMSSGRPVELELDVVNEIYPEGRTAYNVIAEIAGTDKAGEVIMLGGHLDSWHAGTGATDNAVGCAVTMEAVRILTAIGVQPRRTIRIALWSGEEQGLLGSRAYVEEHFGTAEEPKPAHAAFGGYINIDTGTGQARGMTVFGPSRAGDVLRAALAPFKDMGVLGATTTRSRQRGGSDHTSFNASGLPGILVLQDPIEYQSYSWHTNLDTYERIVEDDVKRSAIVIAAAVYHLAMRDDLLPRFSDDDMPGGPGR